MPGPNLSGTGTRGGGGGCCAKNDGGGGFEGGRGRGGGGGGGGGGCCAPSGSGECGGGEGGRCCCSSRPCSPAGAMLPPPVPPRSCCAERRPAGNAKAEAEAGASASAGRCSLGGCGGGGDDEIKAAGKCGGGAAGRERGGGCCERAPPGAAAAGGGCCEPGVPSSAAPCCRSDEPKPDCCSSGAGVGCCSEGKEARDSAAMTAAGAGDGGRRGSGNDPLLCLAVLRNNGASVDVFDAAGKSRSFSYTSSSGAAPGDDRGAGPGNKICFSTHGAALGGMLTPCFDEKGEHGEPEEGCFCGVDTPHLHAHVHDPARCEGGEGGGERKANQSSAADQGFLAQLILHPDGGGDSDGAESGTSDGGECGGGGVVNVPINESLPKQCNSQELSSHLHQKGHGIARLWRNSLRRTRMYKVRHEDHTDFLVHNDVTGDLHLEHPCDSCGDNDLHGKFKLIHTRSWMDDGSEPPPVHRNVSRPPLIDEDNRQDSREIRLHFFEAKREPFSLLNVLSDLIDTDCGRVHAVRVMDDVVEHHHHHHDHHLDHLAHDQHDHEGFRSEDHNAEETEYVRVPLEKEGGANVRSQFYVEKICCASEIPAIRSIVEPLDGVTKVSVNTTVKTVYVDHDPARTTAADVEMALNRESFGAHVKRDGDAGRVAAHAPGQAGGPPRVGRSQFFVQKICCASEIPAIRGIVEPLPGVSDLSVNTLTKTLYVDHDMDLVSAGDIAKALNDEHFGASVKKDAGQAFALMSGIPTTAFVESAFVVSRLRAEEDVRALDDVLAKFPEGHVREHTTHLPTKTVNIEHNPYFLAATGIVNFLRKEGFDASISSDGAADGKWALSLMKEDEEECIEHHTSKVKWHVILSGLFWIISMLSYIGGNWEYLKYVGLLSVAFGIPQIALKSCRTLRRCQFDANCMMLFAALGAVALQEFTEAAAVTFLFSISETLETRATARARNALAAIVSLRPDRANMVNPITKEVVIVPVASVPVGAIVSVRTGDKVPCDGVVIDGQSTVDESSLTGESRPVWKGPQDAVSGGTINNGSTQLVIKTTATADNSAVAKLIRLVEEAQANRSQTEKLVDEFAKRYTPLVVLAALCMCTIPWAFGRDVGAFWTMNGLITIVIACPCALIISTPVTYVAGLAALAQKGVIAKGGACLEAIGSAKHIAFDKTGTLTEGVFALLHLNTIEGRRTRKEVLEYLALMEQTASHPLAAALVAAAGNEGVSIPKHLIVQNHSLLRGEGVTASVDGKEVHVGNEGLFRRLGLYEGLPRSDKELADEWAKCGWTVGFISIESEGIVGAFCVADALRPEAKEVVHALQDLGIEVTMLTGDQRTAAVGVGNQIGLHADDIKSQLLPEDKLEFISGMVQANKKRTLLCNPFSPKRNVLMCGDGVNDAPALALADISVAMGEGAALAMETSDVTLMDSNLNKLLYSIRMGRRVIRTIIENVTFSLAMKALVMGFTFAGKASLWAAIASDVGAMLLVTLNGMKLLPSKKKVKENDIATADQREADGTAQSEETTSRVTLVTEGSALCDDGPNDEPLLAAKSTCGRNAFGCCSTRGGRSKCGGAGEVAVDQEFKNEPACCAAKTCCSRKSNSRTDDFEEHV